MTIGILLLLLQLVIFSLTDAVRIDTSDGPVYGSIHYYRNILTKEYNAVHRFLSIPYAQPPVGKLRFSRPKSINWNKRKDKERMINSLKWPNSCIQDDVNHVVTKSKTKSEDCLFLNIWSPQASSERRHPDQKTQNGLKEVFIWIHGGGFVDGSSADVYFDAVGLSSFTDMIIVTVNHRIGALGFMYSGDGEDEAQGNIGLWDIIMALKYVKKNIKAFGGDPDRINLAGQSSGSTEVSLLVASPVAQDLYSQAIMISGPLLMPSFTQTKAKMLRRTRSIAREIGCPTDAKMIKCLRKVPPVKLAKATTKIMIRNAADNFFAVTPIYGDEIVPRDPRELIQSTPTDRRLLFGTVDYEGSLTETLIKRFPKILKLPKSNNKNDWIDVFVDFAQKLIPNISDEHVDQLIETYFLMAKENTDNFKKAIFKFGGHYSIMCPTLKAALMFSKRNAVKTFIFDYHSKIQETNATGLSPCKTNMVCHGHDTPFLFGAPTLENPVLKYTGQDARASREFMAIIEGFIRGWEGWPDFLEDQRYSFEINPMTEREHRLHDLYDIHCSVINQYI